MLYQDIIAADEKSAIEAVAHKLKIEPDFLRIAERRETEKGVVFRVEATISRGQEAADLLREILGYLGAGDELFFIDAHDKITLNVSGENLGLIIGKNGQTLEAVETLLSAIHNKNHKFYKPISINPGGYRENKVKYLQSLVRHAVEAAVTAGEVSLPPMSRKDRKLVHQFVSEYPGFVSKSVDDKGDRKVKIRRV